jgi:cytochrome c peroxidase
LDNALAVQAMFPVTSRDEMRGDRGDTDIFGQRNELASIKDAYPDKIWDALMLRLLVIPGYVDLFAAAFPDVPADELGFQHAANAIAAYEAAAFTFTDSPWDAYLRGDQQAISEQARRGALLFYGAAGCVDCHSGTHFSDWDYYNLAVPHLGPGKGMEEPLDFGRARETGDDCDLFAFRTPPLRNVALTGPWMHNGTYTTLEGAIRHHLDPAAALRNYDPTQLAPEFQELVITDLDLIEAQLTCPSAPADIVELSDEQIADLLAFLEALTSPTAADLSHIVPETVPSGLAVGGQ